MWRRLPVVVLAFFCLALAITWPTAIDPVRYIPGGERTDLWDGLWSFWFAGVRFDEGVVPMRVDGLLNHPIGGSIWVVDLVNSLLIWPGQKALGLATAWGLLAIVHVTASGVMAWVLARAVTGAELPAWFAGVSYAASPLMLSHLHNGTTEAVGGAYLPAAVWAVWRLYAAPGALRAAVAAALLFACTAAHWYSGVDAFVFWGLALLAAILAWADGARLVVTRVLWLVLAGGAAALLVMPLAHIVIVASSSPDSVVEIKTPEDLAMIRRTMGPADPIAFFHWGDYRSPDFRLLSQFAEDHIHCVYLGYVSLVGAALALRRRSGTALVWAAVVTSLVLALGPVLVVAGDPVLLRPDLPVLLPYSVIEHLPGFRELSLVYRLAQLGVLGLAVLGGLGWSQLGWKGLAAATLALLLEIRFVSPAAELPGHTDGRLPPVLYALAAAPEGAVANYPVAGGRSYLYEQSAHRRPLAGTLNFATNTAALSFWELCLALAEEMDPAVRAQLLAGESHRLGVRYLVVHPDALAQPDALSNAMLVIRSTFRPAIEGDGVEVYRFY